MWGGGGGGGGGGEEGYEHNRCHILYTRHTVTTSSTEPYHLMKIFLTVFKIEGIVALTIQGRYLRKYNKNSAECGVSPACPFS